MSLYRSVPLSLGGARIVIQQDDLLTKISRLTGAVGSAFDSEVIGDIEGFAIR